MAKRKGALKSNNSDLGWSEKHRQNEIHDRKMLTNEMNEVNISLAVSSRDGHMIPNLECQKITHKESSPPDIFNNSSSLKYLHKKFKRVASTVIEDNCVKVTTNVNKTSAECASKFDATIINNFSATAITQSHINKPETNNLYVIENYSELTNVPANCVQNLRKNEFVSRNSTEGVNLSGRDYGVPKENVQQSHKIHATDFSDGTNKSQPDGPLKGSSNTQKTINCESLPEEFRTRTKTGCGLRNFDESPIRSTQNDLLVLSTVIRTDSKNVYSNTESGSASTKRKIPTRRKNSERPYQCATCGIELKSKSQLYKHCRSANHDMKCGNFISQLPSEDVDLDISQSNSSDPELSSCSATTNSDAQISRSTTPLDDVQGTSFVSPSAMNYMASSQGPTASFTGPDKPYKPKFHKAVFYHSNANINNNTSSASSDKDSKPNTQMNRRHDEEMSENLTMAHTLSTQSVEYLKQHISKIISQNEAIMEGVEPALQKKYHKIIGIPRNNSNSYTNVVSEMHVQPYTSAIVPINKNSEEMLLKICDYQEPSSIDSVKTKSRPFPTLQQQATQALKKSSSTTTKSHAALNLSNDSQPLNLSNSAIDANRKKLSAIESNHGSSPIPSTSNAPDLSVAPPNSTYENHHPQNPERSIIKSLLLNSRGLAVPTTGEGEDAVYICPLCNIPFRSADNLQYHTKCYCQGTPQVSLSLSAHTSGSPHSAPISPVGSPSHKYFRSNSFNLYHAEKYSPNTLAKLASSSLRHHRTPLSLAKLAAQQAAGYYLNKNAPTNAAPLFSSVASPSGTSSTILRPLVGHTSTSTSSTGSIITEAQSVSSQCIQITKQLMDASLPSPGPLLGKTRLVDHYNAPRIASQHRDTPNSSNKMEITSVPALASTSTEVAAEIPLFLPNSHKIASKSQKVDEQFTPRSQKLLQMCGGDVKIVEKTEKIPRFGSSGGSIVSISSSSDSIPENSPLSIRSGLLSGGSIIEAIPAKRKSITSSVPIHSPGTMQQSLPNLSRLNSNQNLLTNYFQFPTAINSITAYNPLTLPPNQPEFHLDSPAAIEATKIMHGGKIIPFVPGIPGPNSLSLNAPLSPIIPSIPPEKCQEPIYNSTQNTRICVTNNTVPSIPSYQSKSKLIPNSMSPELLVPTNKPQLSSESIENSANVKHLYNAQHHVWPAQTVAEKPFNFTRIADNLSPSKTSSKNLSNVELNTLNLDKLKQKPKPFIQMPEEMPLIVSTEPNITEPSQMNNRSSHESAPEKIKPVSSHSIDSDKCNAVPSKPSPKFLRPCSLPLKPGTFTAKKHHGITPTANTLPLISPETPRPSKHCVQLYLNGHAYTYLGLKCSTKPFYCTVNRPQPVYAVFAGRPELSMYSNWQTCAENNPHPLGFSPKEVMSMYDSRQRTHINHQGSRFTVSNKLVLTCAASDKTRDSLQTSDSLNCTKSSVGEIAHTPIECSEKASKDLDGQKMETTANMENLSNVPGGYKSNDDYTYVRGRGRGRYVCIECGMRCIKPCTLKKHIRTVHSDIRPYSCRSCMFSFKTKGNLTKHLESKAHYKKCVEKGINPNKTAEEAAASLGEGLSEMTPTDTNLLTLGMEDGDNASDDYSEGDDLEIDMESSDNEDVKLPDHEAAHCLLSLSQRSPCEDSNISVKSLVPRQPNTYPYLNSDLSTVPKTQSNSSEINQNQHDTFIKNDLTISRMGVSMLTELNLSAFNKTETKQRRNHMDSDAIDLSKPRSIPNSIDTKECTGKTTATVTTNSSSYAGAAELLKSLMKLSDKVPAILPPTFDLNLGPVSCIEQHSNLTNNQMQSYLTERALQKSKMKLSQVYTLNAFDEKAGSKLQKESGSAYFSMLSKKLDHIKISPKPRPIHLSNQQDAQLTEQNQKHDQSAFENVAIGDHPMKEENRMEKSVEEKSLQDRTTTDIPKEDTVKVELHIINSSSEIPYHAESANDQSGIETLAEIAANSVKLDAPKSTKATASMQIANVPNSVNTLFITSNKPSSKLALPNEHTSKNEISAKNIASEYLKLANEQDNAATVDESSASSDSDVMADGESKQPKRLSMMPLGPEVLIVVGEDGFKSKSSKSNELPMVSMPRGSSSSNTARTNVAFIQEDGGPSRCKLCPASFPKRHQLVIHMNIHYMNPERKYRCDSCGQNFQTQGRLQKHMRTETHNSKASIAETQGHSKSKNPRPFQCSDCSRAFRIHGHLAKHLRSKTHVQKLECLQKLPFGTYAMIEEARINLTDIDTTDCDNSLASLKALAEKLKVESGSVKTLKKRKLDDGYKETLTIGEGDDS